MADTNKIDGYAVVGIEEKDRFDTLLSQDSDLTSIKYNLKLARDWRNIVLMFKYTYAFIGSASCAIALGPLGEAIKAFNDPHDESTLFFGANYAVLTVLFVTGGVYSIMLASDKRMGEYPRRVGALEQRLIELERKL